MEIIMLSFTRTVDTIFDAIIAFSTRIVRAYVYADEKITAEEPESSISHIQYIEAPAQYVQLPLLQEEHKTSDTILLPASRGSVMYVGSVGVALYKNPAIEYDAQITTLPFGGMVMVGDSKGRFCQVNWKDASGWVLRDDVVDRASSIYPKFVKGVENSVDDANTSYVRTLIKDEFGLARSEFPLQAGEYVLYRLWRRSLRIEWPSARPRVPGIWHSILKGKKGVYMSMIPKVGAIMEYMLNDEVGQLAYVEAVFPDETISISEVNNPDSGIYSERELLKEEWKELRPVFIEIV